MKIIGLVLIVRQTVIVFQNRIDESIDAANREIDDGLLLPGLATICRDRDRLTERPHIWKGGDIKNLILPILLTALATLTTLQVLNSQCNVWPKYVLWVVARCLLCCFCLSVRFFCLLLVASVCFLSELLQYICLQQQRLCLRHCRPVVSQIGHIRYPSYNKGRPLVKTPRYIHTHIHSFYFQNGEK